MPPSRLKSSDSTPMALLVMLRVVRAYNLSGNLCDGAFWSEWRGIVWSVAQSRRSGVHLSQAMAARQHLCYLCPEGCVAACLCLHAHMPKRRKQILYNLAYQITEHWHVPGLLRRLKLGGWPDCGSAQVLEEDVPRLRFGSAADLVLSTTPRFNLATPPAPERILPGWWWPQRVSTWEGLARTSLAQKRSIDLGLRVVLEESPLLTLDSNLLLVDVGAFNGESLLMLALQANLNHSVLAFEPINTNLQVLLQNFGTRGLHDQLRILDPDTRSCTSVATNGSVVDNTCVGLRPSGGHAMLATVGLSAADHDVYVRSAGAFSSVSVSSSGGWAIYTGVGVEEKQHLRLRTGTPIVEWWVREIVGRSCIGIHLMKLDIEGSEFSALRGFEPLLAEHRIRFIFLEFWPLGLMTWGSDPLGILRWMAHYGFVCRFLGRPATSARFLVGESFENFIDRHTSDEIIVNYTGEMSFEDLLCEDQYWEDPCLTHSHKGSQSHASSDLYTI